MKDELAIGIVGQITPRKGQLELIETFARTQKQIAVFDSARCRRSGFQSGRCLFREIKTNGKRFGNRNEREFSRLAQRCRGVNAGSRFVVINSKSEALVLVAIEAMACGTPIIATDVGGTTEIIEHKTNGWIVPFGDENALTRGITTLGQR